MKKMIIIIYLIQVDMYKIDSKMYEINFNYF